MRRCFKIACVRKNGRDTPLSIGDYLVSGYRVVRGCKSCRRSQIVKLSSLGGLADMPMEKFMAHQKCRECGKRGYVTMIPPSFR